MRLRGGALLVSISIAMIIAILSGLLILLAAHYKQQESGVKLYKKLTVNSRSAITLLLTDYKLTSGEKTVLDLYGEQSDSVLLQKRAWGAYEILTSSAFSGNKKVSQTVLCGYQTRDSERAALYLPDLGRPLNLCGRTNIRGTAYLPEAGARRSFIEGRGYEGTVLVDGETKKSENNLPELSKEILANIENLLSGKSTSTMLPVSIKDTLVNSFHDSTLLVYGGTNLMLQRQYWKGNIVVKADSLIVVGNNTQLENIILLAPVIIFENNLSTKIQAFASDSIVVRKNARLKYPSILGLIKSQAKKTQSYIRLHEGSELRGMAFATVSNDVASDFQNVPLVHLMKTASVEGEVYSAGFVEIAGEIRGSLYCNKFVLHTSSGTYENHLLDAVIDAKKINKDFVSTGLLKANDHKKVVQWLY